MDQIKVSSVLNGLGLIIDMFGVLLMFQKADVTTYIFNEAEIPGVNKRKNFNWDFGYFSVAFYFSYLRYFSDLLFFN